MRRLRSIVPGLAFLVACGATPRQPDAPGTGGLTTAGGADTDGDAPGPTTGDPGGSTGEDPGDDSGGSTGGDDPGDDSGGPLFDVGDHDPDGPSPEEGCQKVDLLFVIDDSGSMSDNQQELISSFPEFIDGIKTQLGDIESYHVGVVTTDAYQYNGPGCGAAGMLVTQTGGENSSNAVCGPYATGSSHMDENDDLLATFSCAAQVGTVGSGSEKPIDSIRGALDPAVNGPGECNEGFLRQDALLVIVIITDEDDQGGIPAPFFPPLGSAGDPASWFNDIVALKGGIETNIALLSLLGDLTVPNDCADGQAMQATNLIELTGLFTNGVVGDVCASSYAPFFQQAVSVVDSACNDFVPPG